MNNTIKRKWNINGMVQIEDLRGMTFQDEAQAHTFEISGVDDAGNDIQLTGSVGAIFLRSDNTDVAIVGSMSGGVASVTLPAECYDAPGRFGLTVFLISGSQKTAIYACIGSVTTTSSGNVSPETSEDVADLIAAIEAAVASIPADYSDLWASLAPNFSTSTSYLAGQYVTYNGNVYRFTSPHSAGSWDGSQAEQTAVGNELYKLMIVDKRAVCGINVKVDINTTDHSAAFTGGRVASSGHIYTIPSGTTVSNIPQDTAIHWLICDLNASNDTCSFRIVNTSFTDFSDGVVFVGYTYKDTFALLPGFYVFNDGMLVHDDFTTWTEYNQNIVRCLHGPERMLIIDLQNQVVTVPADMVIISGNKTITSTATAIDFSGISGTYLYVYYDGISNTFGITASSLNRNRNMIIAIITRNVNYVWSVVPAVVITKEGQYYNVCPETVVYGDSIVAGAGGLGFENIISARAGIRMLNYGIGSTGYVTRVTQGTTHLAGNGKPSAGSNTVIDYAENNVTDRITANISNISQNIIVIMAGTNDVASGVPVADIISAVETCINTIFNAGKIPVIISPIRRENVNLDAFHTALKEKCEDSGVVFIDVYNCGINPNNSYNKTKYIPDGIHPNDAGYYILSAAIAEGMRKVCMVGKYY